MYRIDQFSSFFPSDGVRASCSSLSPFPDLFSTLLNPLILDWGVGAFDTHRLARSLPHSDPVALLLVGRGVAALSHLSIPPDDDVLPLSDLGLAALSHFSTPS